jgi:hypothetical protein
MDRWILVKSIVLEKISMTGVVNPAFASDLTRIEGQAPPHFSDAENSLFSISIFLSVKIHQSVLYRMPRKRKVFIVINTLKKIRFYRTPI